MVDIDIAALRLAAPHMHSFVIASPNGNETGSANHYLGGQGQIEVGTGQRVVQPVSKPRQLHRRDGAVNNAFMPGARRWFSIASENHVAAAAIQRIGLRPVQAGLQVSRWCDPEFIRVIVQNPVRLKFVASKQRHTGHPCRLGTDLCGLIDNRGNAHALELGQNIPRSVVGAVIGGNDMVDTMRQMECDVVANDVGFISNQQTHHKFHARIFLEETGSAKAIKGLDTNKPPQVNKKPARNSSRGKVARTPGSPQAPRHPE